MHIGPKKIIVFFLRSNMQKKSEDIEIYEYFIFWDTTNRI